MSKENIAIQILANIMQIKGGKQMNRDIKPVVYSILEKDKLAREDTMYLIQQTIIKMLDVNQGTAFGIVIQGMKYKGISFEAITRAKRKFLEDHPELLEDEIEQIRRQEQQAYEYEYSRHVPNIL